MTYPSTGSGKSKNWQRKRKPKWRDVYVKARMTPSWKKYRKRQTWRPNRKGL